jgi:hypothetical protein
LVMFRGLVLWWGVDLRAVIKDQSGRYGMGTSRATIKDNRYGQRSRIAREGVI